MGVMTAFLTLPSSSHLCDLNQGNFSTSLTWWDFLSAASNQNTRLYHAHGLYGNLFLLRLLRSSFIFSSYFKEGLSLICISTCSSGMFKGVYCWLRVEEPTFLLSRSFFSPVRAFFGLGPCSGWHGRSTSICSALFLFLAIIVFLCIHKVLGWMDEFSHSLRLLQIELMNE